MVDIMLMKSCRRCFSLLPLSDFHVDNGSSDGACSYCRDCKRILRHEWYTKHQEQVLEQNKEFYETNRERVLARRRELYHLKQKAAKGATS